MLTERRVSCQIERTKLSTSSASPPPSRMSAAGGEQLTALVA
jgi:hypothetical protein